MGIVVLPASCNKYFHSLGGGGMAVKNDLKQEWLQWACLYHHLDRSRRKARSHLSASPSRSASACCPSCSCLLPKTSEVRWGSLEELVPQPHVSSHNDNTSWSCLRRHKQVSKGKITHTFAFITFSYLVTQNQQLDKSQHVKSHVIVPFQERSSFPRAVGFYTIITNDPMSSDIGRSSCDMIALLLGGGLHGSSW